MPREYSQAGIDYTKIEPFKQAMQVTGKRTLNFPNQRGVYISEEADDRAMHYVAESDYTPSAIPQSISSP